MTSYYDEVTIEEMEYCQEKQIFYYPCPCGDKFQLTMDEIFAGNDIAKCPSCSLMLKVIYDPEDFIEESAEEEETVQQDTLIDVI